MGEYSTFGVVDYIVVAATLLFSLLIGIYYAVISKHTNEDLLHGGRQMKVWPIACSILVTYLSAITVLGYPAEIYAHGIQIYMITIMMIIFVPLLAYLFAYPLYYMKFTSVYEYVELRFESSTIRCVGSTIYIIQTILTSGVVVYAPSIALETILGLPTWICVGGIGLCGTVYTSIGGLKAVVWTDVFQFVMIVVGMAAMVVRGLWKAGGVFEAFERAEQHGRLNLIDFTVDPFMRHNTLNFVFGYGLLILFTYGTYQSQVQRYCSLPSLKLAVRSLFLSVVLHVFTMSLVTATGIAIFATYAGCDPVLLGEIKKSDEIVPYFVKNELYFVPGMLGLFVSCIFSAVLSSLSSSLNSLSAVTWQDFFSHRQYFANLSEFGQANTSRLLAAFYGVLVIGAGFAAQYMGPVLQAVLTAVGAIGGVLGALFIQGLFIPFANKWGAMSGLVVGMCSMTYIAVMSFQLDKPFSVPLPSAVDNCPIGTNMSLAGSNKPGELGQFDWPEKLFTLSYLMYSCAGALVSIAVSIPVSIISGGCCSARKVNRNYLHPLLRRCCGVDDNFSHTASFSKVGDKEFASPSRPKRLMGPVIPDSPQSPYLYQAVPTQPLGRRNKDR